MTPINEIIHADCLETLGNMDENSIDLIYCDPPFFTQKDWGEYSDEWKSSRDHMRYIEQMLDRCFWLLKRSGSIYLHCDRFATHRLRVLMDEIFDEENFRAEIIWAAPLRPHGFKTQSNNWVRGHDTIHYYGFLTRTFHKQYEPYDEDYIAEFDKRDKKGNYKMQGKRRVYLKEGYNKTDVWTDIPIPMGKERCGYPTQKPLALLERIIKASSNEGDLVLDPMCGSGTTCVAAKRLGRNYIGIDQNENAAAVARKRLDEVLL